MTKFELDSARAWEDRLRHLRGSLFVPGTPGYDEARALWNGMIDRRPAVIVRCADEQDVAAAVRAVAASDRPVPLAVRGGGHHVAGLGSVDDGVVLDLSDLRAVHVDPERRRAVVQGGATWADVDAAKQPHGLATPGGVVSKTGVAGLTLGGGIGWLRRAYGLSCDNLEAATVVTGEGTVVRADATSAPELLWGLRGGGGTLGVVTSFEFRLHPVGPEVAFTFVLYPLTEARDVVRGHERLLQQDDGSISTLLTLGFAPADEAIPPAHHGAPFIGVLAMHAGPSEEGLRAMRPLRALAEPLADLSDVLPYGQAQQLLDADYPDGGRYYWSSLHVPNLPEALVDRLVEHTRRAPSPSSTVDVWHHGGAMRHPPDGGAAHGSRDRPYLITYEANWTEPEDDAANVAWARDALREVAAFDASAGYVNFPGFREDGAGRVREEHLTDRERFEALRRRVDPDGLFRREALPG